MVLSALPVAIVQALASVVTAGVIAGGPSNPPSSDPPPDPVAQVIVRYSDGAPAKRVDGRPWGAQCVDSRYRDRLRPGRALGERMFVVRIRPAVSPEVAKRIIRQMEKCPGVAWAETATVIFAPAGRAGATP